MPFELTRGSFVGEYRIERELGQGGMGAVYLAVQPIIDKKVAVKVLQAALSQAPEYAQRFLDEARAVVQIGHRNIVDVFAFGRLPDDRLYYVMEFLEGATLAQRLAAGDLSAEELRRLLAEICDALGEAHRHKIVHRDLKPDNIWIARPARAPSYAKILDFGIAKLERGSNKVTQTGAQIGTPLYMAPEQWHGRGVDARADIYSLGVILYQVFAGRLPFAGESAADLMLAHLMNLPAPPSGLRAMAPALESLILQCLEKDPAARPGSAAEVAARLDGALATVPVGAGVAARVNGAPPTLSMLGVPASAAAGAAPRGRPRGWLVIGLVALAAAGVGAVVMKRSRGPASVVLTSAPPPTPAPALAPSAAAAREVVPVSVPPAPTPATKAAPTTRASAITTPRSAITTSRSAITTSRSGARGDRTKVSASAPQPVAAPGDPAGPLAPLAPSPQPPAPRPTVNDEMFIEKVRRTQ